MSDPLSILVGLLRELRDAETPQILYFTLVNATRRLLPYDCALLLRPAMGKNWRVVAASGASSVERGAPLVQWLERATAKSDFAPQASALHEMESTAQERGDIGLHHALWVPLIEPGGALIGALWLDRREPWREAEAALLEETASAGAHALRSFDKRRPASGKARWLWPVLAAVAVAALFLPMQRAALAPAEIIARDAEVVAAPIDGVIRSFDVKPNQRVNIGDVLFTLDDTDRRARLEVAAKALDVARVEYRQASQGALGGRRDVPKLAALEAQISLKEVELDNARKQMQRTRARAGRAGIALSPDVQEFIGRPVVAGERVMLVAAPDETEARAWLAVHDALPVADGAAVRVFLDTDPLNPLDGKVIRIHHEAEETPVGMAYRVMVALNPAAQAVAPRVGSKGTARIDGDRAPLFLHLFRRPIAALRQTLGF